MQALWDSLFYEPIYNTLVLVLNNVTFGDVGFAIILITIIVKLILSPLTKRSTENQILMKKMEPELKLIKKNFPNKEEQSKKTFELYKKYKTNPFSGCLLIFIQIPIILALYFVVFNYIKTGIDLSSIYSFVTPPTSINTNFLGFFEMGSKSIILAVLAGVAQFIQGHLASPINTKKDIIDVKDINEKKGPSDFQENLASSMQMNIKYLFPIMMVFISWQTSAAVALYFIISTLFTVIQEIYIRRKLSIKID